MLLNPLTLHTPRSLSEALKIYAEYENIKLQAGGTFLFNSLKLLKRRGIKTVQHVINLGKIEELRGISQIDDVVTIGAMTTISELIDCRILTENLAILKLVAKNISTTPIRNMATVGGNLTCRYTWTELPAVMIGLGADLHFMGTDGKTETTRAELFFENSAKTDKICTHVTIQKDPAALVTYRRVKKTPNVDIPLLSLLIKTNGDGGRFNNTHVSINNCISFAKRDSTLEEFLNQNAIGKDTAREALNHLETPIYDTRSNDYKKHMFRQSLKSALEELATF